ncbi:MAG: hypothetical protein CM1200mP27_00730 [Chloroflexota bacterium]|nr:MAG: hypothetical protein CM1200mP27_00730 [Chloroflexota bacterium]
MGGTRQSMAKRSSVEHLKTSIPGKRWETMGGRTKSACHISEKLETEKTIQEISTATTAQCRYDAIIEIHGLLPKKPFTKPA